MTARAATLAAAVVAFCAAACGPAVPGTPGTGSPAVTVAPGATQAPPGAPALLQVRDPGQVTGTLTGPCHALDGGQLPDPKCTPGAYDPAITAVVLCAAGYSTRTYRPPSSQTSAFKYHVAYPAYGIPDATSAPSELDHLVSLELGGSNDAANLWPEMGPIPNPKDSVENQLHNAVCAGRVTLHDAQAAIAGDWLTAEQVLGITPGTAATP